MSSQVYREHYLAALEVAHSELDNILREFEIIQLRKEQIEHAVGALEPFLHSAPPASYEAPQPNPVYYEARQPEPIHLEPIHLEPARVAPVPEIIQPSFRATPAPEPVAPAAFAPASESMDPIQNRINRALGLAVA